MVLAYVAVWRASQGPGEGAAPSGPAAREGRMPWILIVLFAASAVYAIVYLLIAASRPPSF